MPARTATMRTDEPACVPACLCDYQSHSPFASGQRVTVDELLSRHQAEAYGVAYRLLGDHADAADAVQEAFISAWTHLDQFQGDSSFRTWLLRIVRHAALNLGRKRERRARLLQCLARDERHALHLTEDRRTPLQGAIDQEEHDRAAELSDAVWNLLMRVSTARMRKAIEMLWKGWDYHKIAGQLGCCEKTVRADLVSLRARAAQELAATGSVG